MSEQLISADIQSGTFNYKVFVCLFLLCLLAQFTFSVEIVPICKDDIVCLPLSLARSNGNIKSVPVFALLVLMDHSQIVICERIGSTIHLIDPMTLQRAEVCHNTSSSC